MSAEKATEGERAAAGSFGIEFSRSAVDALCWAAAVAKRRGGKITAHHVFMGVLLAAQKDGTPNSGRSVRRQLEQQLDGDPIAWFESVNGHSPETRPEQDVGGFRRSDFDATGRAVVEKAISCARATESKAVHLRHLVGSVLDDRDHQAAKDAGLLGDNGLAFAQLASAFWRTNVAAYPDARAWKLWSDREAKQKVPDRTRLQPPLVMGGEPVQPHVFQAIQAASVLAGTAPVRPVHVVRAIAQLDAGRSVSFQHLHTLVKFPPEPSLSASVDHVLFEEHFERQLAFATDALRPYNGRNTLGGRELIGAALLAGGEDLDDYLKRCGSSLSQLRDAWYEFVVAADERPTVRQQWDDWWAFARVSKPGVPRAIPAKEGSEAKFREVKAIIEAKSEDWRFVYTALGWAAAIGRLPAHKDMRDVVPLLAGLLKQGLDVTAGFRGLDLDRLASAYGFHIPPHPLAVEKPSMVGPRAAALVERGLSLWRQFPSAALADAVFLAMFEPTMDGSREVAPIAAPLMRLGLFVDETLAQLERGLVDRKHPALAIIRHIRPVLGQTWSDRPHLDSDRVNGPISEDRDLLDARKPALRFAKLLAARKVDPPIALGLFGNWGAGKTFFMGLMRDHIDKLCKSGNAAYHRRVVQIDFNAWHYHDTNLWASLALRIFDGLAEELGNKQPSAVEARRKEIHQKIHSSEIRRVDAETRREGALDRRAQAAKDLDAKRAQQEKIRRESVETRLKVAWTAATKREHFADLQKAAGTLAKQFGLPAALTAAGDVAKLKAEIVATANRGHGLLTAVGQRFRGVSAAVAATTVISLGALLALGFGWGTTKLAAVLHITRPELSGLIVQIATLVSAAAAWCGRRVKDLQDALDVVTQVEADLATAERTLSETEEIKKLAADLTELDKQIHQATEQVTAAEREIAEATAEIDHINSGGMVYDFLQGRRTSTSYLSQLGLISTIRQDFDKLHDLLADFGKNGMDPIDRVVLYIDDLDRCHPDKVVEVLQAVHLLLAFDLFNVVVGVDARWLERSLQRKYMAGVRNTKAAGDFSPQDYLEKIFQIPYSLGPIPEQGFKDLIAGMIETRADWKSKRDKERQADKQGQKADPRDKFDMRPGPSAEAADRSILPAPTPPGSRPEAPDLAASPASAPPTSPNDVRTNDPSASTPTEDDAQSTVLFEDFEETFIQTLHAFVDRPRLAKRLVNIYRLLRVRAHDEGTAGAFLGSEQFRAALILLAINVGHAKLAPKLLRAIETASPQNQTFLALLDGLSKTGSSAVALSEPELAEIVRVAAKLRRIGADVPDDLTPYKIWAPRVACYSFDWYRGDEPETVLIAGTPPEEPLSPEPERLAGSSDDAGSGAEGASLGPTDSAAMKLP